MTFNQNFVRMNALQKNIRPTCEEVLLEKKFWSLSLTDLKNNSEFKSGNMEYSDAKYLKITHKAINSEDLNSVPILLQDIYVNEFSKQNLIYFGSFGFVSKVVNKNSRKIYAIKKIALNKVEFEKAFKELNLMEKLKSRFVIEHIDSWIEKNTLNFEE